MPLEARRKKSIVSDCLKDTPFVLTGKSVNAVMKYNNMTCQTVTVRYDDMNNYLDEVCLYYKYTERVYE